MARDEFPPPRASNKTREDKIALAATMLAAAYWRGKLECVPFGNEAAREALIKHGVELDAERWITVARRLFEEE